MKSVFEEIPGVGPRLSCEIEDLGYECVEELRLADPEKMYVSLCDLRGEKIDRCVLYVFRCACYYASHETHEAEKLKWWNWKDA